MPSDNLEKLFKQKVAEVQHTPPPFSWDKEDTWQKLQPTLRLSRRKRVKRLYYSAAAVLVLMLAGALLNNLPDKALTAATQKAEKPLPTTASQPMQNPVEPEPSFNSKSENNLITTAVNAINQKRVLKNTIGSEKRKIQPKTEPIRSNVPETLASLPKTESTNILLTGQVESNPKPEAKPIKITIVLGAKSIAKLDAQAKEEQSVAKKDKLRFRMNLPGAEAAEISQMATNNSYHKPLMLGTKIKL